MSIYKGFDLEEFNYWVFEMDNKLEAFLDSLPKPVSSQLDYSIDSLEVLEKWLVERYGEKPQRFEALDQAIIVDGACRYAGESLRKQFGGNWDIDFNDQDEESRSVPFVTGFNKEKKFCPYVEFKNALKLKTGSYVLYLALQLAEND